MCDRLMYVHVIWINSVDFDKKKTWFSIVRLTWAMFREYIGTFTGYWKLIWIDTVLNVREKYSIIKILKRKLWKGFAKETVIFQYIN